jgi:hypothetical protein
MTALAFMSGFSSAGGIEPKAITAQPEAKCPRCGHAIRLHMAEFGCVNERDDIAAQDGALCECKYAK